MLLALAASTSTQGEHTGEKEECSQNVSGYSLAKASVARSDGVYVVFGDESITLPKATLQQLPYFSTRLTQRWSQQGSNSICVSNNNCSFGPNDLNLLFKCIDLGHIPRDRVLSLKQLETLANCADFLCAGPNAFLNKSKLINFFEKRVPPLTVMQREEWLVDCNNKLIRQALYEYNKLLWKRISLIRGNFVNAESSVWDDENFTKISYDSDSAASLFRHKFKFVVTKTLSKLTIQIEGFNKSHFDHLWKLFDMCNYWHLFGKDISNLVENLQNWNETHVLVCKTHGSSIASIACEEDNFECITKMLNCARVEPPHGIKAYQVLISFMNAIHCRILHFMDCFGFIGAHVKRMKNVDQAEQVTNHFMWSYDDYVALCKERPEDTAENREQKEKNRKIALSWHKCLQYLLGRCSKEFLVSNANKWFSILHDMPRIIEKEDPSSVDKVVSFVFDKLIVKFDTQSAFDFGMFLVDFLVYQKKIESGTLKGRYFMFLKQNVGLTWNFLDE